MSASFAETDPRTLTPVADLSRTGALVVGPPIHAIGARIVLRFVAFPDDPIVFEHTGCVVRYVRDPPMMGVEFDAMSPEIEARLDDVLARADADAGSPRRRRAKRVLLEGRELRVHLGDE